MALNFFLQIKNLAKTDKVAAELLDSLQKAKTDEEKNTAKENAKNYLQTLQASDANKAETEMVPEDTGVVAEPDKQDVRTHDSQRNTENGKESPEESTQKESKIMDLSAPAFTPRLAKCGITREEELFLKGVFVRKLTREDKLAIRRSIYQKKTLRNSQIQAEYKAKRIEQKQKTLNDPEVQAYHRERKYVSAIVNALEQHCNLGWMFSHIDGLTPDIVKELIEKPANVNAFRQANPSFIDNFRKKYGE